MRRRRGFNPKRRLRKEIDRDYLCILVERVGYGGNPEHKRNPGDFGLKPPSNPRPDKSLCDAVGIFERNKALTHLRDGILRGMISQNEENGFPCNIWTVTEENLPLEAQLENREQGVYHGYPMPETDPFRELILRHWKK